MYPQPIEQTIAKIMVIVKQSKFVNDELEENVFHEVLGEHLLPKFIKGETLDLTQEETEIVLLETIVKFSKEKLIKVGLLDCVEDENGKMIYFLTAKAKEMESQNSEISRLIKDVKTILN